MVQYVSFNQVRRLKNPVDFSRTNTNKFYPHFPKIHTKETGYFNYCQGINEVFCSKKPGCGANLVLSSFNTSYSFLTAL
jgi:hypothetical protein